MDGPQSVADYQNLISEVIKKQVTLLGSGIALSRVQNVPGLTVSVDGTVTGITGDSREILQKVIDEYFAFSGMIVKKAMESLLSSYPTMAGVVEKVAEKEISTQTQPPIKGGNT